MVMMDGKDGMVSKCSAFYGQYKVYLPLFLEGKLRLQCCRIVLSTRNTLSYLGKSSVLGDNTEERPWHGFSTGNTRKVLTTLH